ncbi:coiled-coil domain-containing protein 146-like [Ruditapes philippinarum]|uniref:coiled-coil domain-containing protein 146-like n=1 Tax=Ruditapes philippinarum TaxID=129788 RepID=UPI00295B0002|nr:coiled-coil domain-containing protein 146-like [Ruditapes philippinarum]
MTWRKRNLTWTMILRNEKDREMEVLQKDFKYVKDREAVLMGKRATFDLNLRHIHLGKKNAHDVHSRKMREKDCNIRNLKKAELQIKVTEETINHTKLIHEKIKGHMDSLPKDDDTLHKKREELQNEMEQTKQALTTQV